MVRLALLKLVFKVNCEYSTVRQEMGENSYWDKDFFSKKVHRIIIWLFLPDYLYNKKRTE